MPCGVEGLWTECDRHAVARRFGGAKSPSAWGCEMADAALIADDDALANRIAALGPVVGVDTEFIRVRTFHPIPALYQLAGDGVVVLVDGQASATFASFKTLLLDPTRTKVMHSCSEDLEVMARHFDLRPVQVVDTQIANAFLTPDFSTSYARLVERYLGLRLAKHETRSDWLQRPLSAEQIAYAREDAAYLKPIWEKQRMALAARGRLEWFQEEMQWILGAPVDAPDTWYRNLKGIWRLSSHELAVLRSLVGWREREARRRDVPRAWTVRDEPLFVMARRHRLDAQDAARMLPKRTGRRYAKALAEAHRQGLEDPHPPSRVPRPLNTRASEVVRELRSAARSAAERLGMAPELVARKRDLETALRHYRDHGELSERFRGWRGEVVGDACRKILATHGERL